MPTNGLRTSPPRTHKSPALNAPAIVLGLLANGLAIARALHAQGVTVYGGPLYLDCAGRATRTCRIVGRQFTPTDELALCDWLVDFAAQLPERPVLFPTGDAIALLLARHRERLAPVARIPANEYDSLLGIIDKARLYRTAAAAGVLVPPTLNEPTLDEARAWCSRNPGPYLIKPPYDASTDNALNAKNLAFDDAAGLLAFLDGRGSAGGKIIIQKIIQGGDGWILDCYGYCDENGRVRALASHRRIRQMRPNFGSTCYGEIPGLPPGPAEASLFAETERLLAAVRYHGIFGIEWVEDRETSARYLLDFNARAFLTIGHLMDCGLDLAGLRYRDQCGEDLGEQVFSADRRLLWVDFWRDLDYFIAQRPSGQISVAEWLASLLRARSFAYWKLTDPGPGLLRGWTALERVEQKVLSRFRGAKPLG